MERRLIPVNMLIALCAPGDVYPSPFSDAGYHLSGIEIPVAAGDGRVVIDAVIFRTDRNIILAGEAKSGANVDEDQARRYGQLDSDAAVIAAAITIRRAGDRHLQPVYVCLSENRDGVLQGLDKAGLKCPVLAGDDDRIERYGETFLDPDVQAAFSQPLPAPGPTPRIIPVDDESPDEAFDTLVLPALVVALSHHRPQISIPTLAEQTLQHLAIFGKAARNRLVSKVDAAARRIAEQDSTTFEYKSRTASRDYAVVHFVRSPEEAARQGRTQVYQSIARAAGRPSRRRRAPSDDQMALFDDLIKELQQADEAAEANEAANDEEEEEQ